MIEELADELTGNWADKGYELAEFHYRTKFIGEVKLLEEGLSEEVRAYLEKLLKQVDEQIKAVQIETLKVKNNK